MLPGSSMGLPGATLTRLDDFAGKDRTSSTIAVTGTPTSTSSAGMLSGVFFFLCVSRFSFFFIAGVCISILTLRGIPQIRLLLQLRVCLARRLQHRSISIGKIRRLPLPQTGLRRLIEMS